MKRKLFIMLTLMFTVLSTWATPPQQPQKSEAEKFVQNLAKIKSDEISYAYISANMFKQLFIKTDLDEEIQESIPFIKSLKSLRRFFTNGKQGYDVMKAALQPLLQEKEEVLGMTLMASNRDGGGSGELDRGYSTRETGEACFEEDVPRQESRHARCDQPPLYTIAQAHS